MSIALMSDPICIFQAEYIFIHDALVRFIETRDKGAPFGGGLDAEPYYATIAKKTDSQDLEEETAT